jgi:hypothetical protein
MDSHDAQRVTPPNSVVGGLAVLVVRGILLWLVVPVAAVVWPVAVLFLRRRGITFGRFLGWVDLNLIACLQRTILRPLVRTPLAWVPARDMAEVTHRLRGIDPV